MSVRKRNIIINSIQFILLSLLVFLVFLMIDSINNVQGNSRVINYAGIVRGSTQRLVKLEISGNPNDEIIDYLDSILLNLQTGSGTYNLNRLDDDAYQQKLYKLMTAFEKLKQEIYDYRENSGERSLLLSLSEEYYRLANDTVGAAENYSQGEESNLLLLETALIIILILVLSLIGTQVLLVVLTNRKNKELSELAYIDAATSLPNRYRCDNVIFDNKHMDGKMYACVMFDLNNLKQTNDKYGHKAGDELIFNFAGILLSISSKNVFVGRYGGDEFIAILSDTSQDEVDALLQNIDVKIDYHNNNKSDIPISCAYGYELTVAGDGFSLQTLLIKADEKMYNCKTKMKAAV